MILDEKTIEYFSEKYMKKYFMKDYEKIFFSFPTCKGV